ncbi:hypothetical protein VZT92_016064 [Zoarces viviparus]|uniref:Uncharacterized protein n=1 Tax=Zoarces viviparus TaxID=48416 RepID=A0AAW1ESW7_ZOAVI
MCLSNEVDADERLCVLERAGTPETRNGSSADWLEPAFNTPCTGCLNGLWDTTPIPKSFRRERWPSSSPPPPIGTKASEE